MMRKGMWLSALALVAAVAVRCVASTVDADCDLCGGEVCFHHPGVADGVCGPAGAPVSCDDGNPCTADACNPADGSCGHAAIVGCCVDDADCNACVGLGCRVDVHRCGRAS